MNKKVAAGVAAVILAASVGANRAFEPSELVHSAEYLARHTQHAPVRLAGEDPLAQLEDYERISLPDAVRAWFIRLPVAVKSTLLLPLWALGAIPAALRSSMPREVSTSRLPSSMPGRTCMWKSVIFRRHTGRRRNSPSCSSLFCSTSSRRRPRR